MRPSRSSGASRLSTGVPPSFTTISSRLACVCASTLATARVSQCGRSKVGMITDTSGGAVRRRWRVSGVLRGAAVASAAAGAGVAGGAGTK